MLGVEVTPHVLVGSPAKDIAAQASEIAADLVVIATHGRSGLDRLVLGSTCDKLIRASPVPVLVVKHPEHEFVTADGGEMTLGKILVPCDFSDFSRAAVPVAADLCRKFGATLALEHVVDTWLDYPEFAPQIGMNNSPHLSEAAQESLDNWPLNKTASRRRPRCAWAFRPECLRIPSRRKKSIWSSWRRTGGRAWPMSCSGALPSGSCACPHARC
jgi:nucleotide-binding universal stress UspA family protein